MKNYDLRKPTFSWSLVALLVFSLLWSCSLYAQNESSMPLSLNQAISIARANNKSVSASLLEKDATLEDLKDAKAAILPTVSLQGSFQRFTQLTLYSDGLSHAKSIPKNPGPTGADGSLAANFNLYSGGRSRALISEQEHRQALSDIGVNEASGGITLQVASQYLDIIRLSGQKGLVLDQIIRAETRLRNINALYRNQKVTRSDVLRAELTLSSVKLILDQTKNDIDIAGRKLSVLLNLPDSVKPKPTDTLGSSGASLNTLEDLVTIAPKSAFGVQRLEENILLQGARIKGIRSNYLPSLSLFSAYGINYPNTIFFPPVDQAYSIGFIGIKLQYNISSLYHNKHKVSAGNIRLKSLEIQRDALQDNVAQEARSLEIKYREALTRISVIQQQIEQTAVNYKIVSAKYFNQLALLTDLLDADNLYQESHYNLIQAQANLQLILYRLEFTSGKL